MLAALVAVAVSAILASSAFAVTISTDPDPASPVPGTNLAYAIDGPATVMIPAGTSVVSVRDGCVAALDVVTCPQASTLTVRVPSDAQPGSILTALATDSTGDSTATTTVAPGVADLSTTVSPLVAGGLATWLVTLHNAGPSDADDPSVAMPIPAGSSFASATQVSGPAFSCAHDDAAVTCSGAHLPSGADAIFEFVLAVPDGTTAVAPIASATTADPDHANDGSSAGVTVTPPPPPPPPDPPATPHPDPLPAPDPTPDPLPLPDPGPAPDPPRQVITLGNAVEGAGSGSIFVPVGCTNVMLGFCRTTVTIRFAKPHQKLRPIVRRLQIASGQTSVAFMSGSLAQRRKIRVVRRLRITVTATNPPGPPVKRASTLSGHPRPRR